MPKVLVIDDDQALCQVLATLLAEEGFQARTARDGQEGLNILRQESRWVVLLDLMMPGMDGRAFLQALRDDPVLLDGNKVVVMSAAGNLPEELQSVREPMQAILPKPFEIEHVLALVNQLASQFV